MPSGEQQKFGKGDSGKGPTRRSASRSLFHLETTICGCTRAFFRLGDSVTFERFRFNKRSKQAGETYDQYKTALRKLAEDIAWPSGIRYLRCQSTGAIASRIPAHLEENR